MFSILKNAALKKTVLSGVLAATVATGALAGATPALADPYRGGWHGGYEHHGGGAGVAVAAGILGLAVGAAIASDHPHRTVVYEEPAYVPPPPPRAYYVRPGWVWQDGYYWDGDGYRYDRWGRPCGHFHHWHHHWDEDGD